MRILIACILLLSSGIPAFAKGKTPKRLPASRSGFAAHTPINVLCKRGKDSIAFVAGEDKKSVARIDVFFKNKKYSFDQVGGIFTNGLASSDYPHNKYLAGNEQNELISLDYSNGEGFGALGTKPEDNAFVTGFFLKERDNTVLAVNTDDGIPLTTFDCKKMK